MPVSRHTNDTPAKPTGTDPAARLRDIRARVSSLRERLAGEHDPKLVDAINVEMKKLSDLLSELISAAGKGTHQVAKAERIVWPHDLSAEAKSPGDWGADPMEVTIE